MILRRSLSELNEKINTSTTATPTQIPRITPQLSRSHFSTLVIQPWRREKEREVKENMESGGLQANVQKGDEWLRDPSRT